MHAATKAKPGVPSLHSPLTHSQHRKPNHIGTICMPKLNKYNIQAIRKKLEDCIRNKSWNKFRTSFEPLSLELQTAVSKAQTGKSRQSSSPPLLCILLESIVDVSSCPPVDLFQLILQACPISCKSDDNDDDNDDKLPVQFYPNHNPLLIAVDRDAPIAVIAMLLKFDETNEMIYRTNKLQRGSEPPILRVSRQLHKRYDDYYEQVLRLMVANDETKQSLLIPSSSKKKIALYYMCNDFVGYLPIKVSMDGSNRNIALDSLSQFMLVQTQQALEIQQGSRKPTMSNRIDKESSKEANGVEDNNDNNDSDDDDDENDEVGFFASTAKPLVSTSSRCSPKKVITTRTTTTTTDLDGTNAIDNDAHNARAIKLIQATITCSHLLGLNQGRFLLQHLVYRTLDFSVVDEHGNSLLHCISSAMETEAFLEEFLVHNGTRGLGKQNLVQYLVTECPNMLTQRNKNGDIPLHLAIRCDKRLGYLKELCPQPHSHAVLSTADKDNQLPLHLVIEQLLPLRRVDAILDLAFRCAEAIAVVDGKYGLYPYQLVAAIAAAHKQPNVDADQPPRVPRRKSSMNAVKEPKKKEEQCKSSSSNMEGGTCVMDLDLSYQLLRAAPEVLQHVTS